MSNRNFDASTIIKILKAQNAANNHNRYQSLENASINQLQPNSQTEHYDADVVNEYNAGSQAYYFQGVPITTVMSPVIFPAIAPTGSGSGPIILPGAPTIVDIIPGDGTLVVYFDEGTDGSSPFINYAYSTDGGITFTPFSSAQTSNPLIITTNLTNNTSYNVVIQAITQDGNSPSSNALSGTPLAAPPAPTILSIITGISGTAVVYFSQDPYYPDITGYQYSWGAGYRTASSSISPITITGLSNNVTYTTIVLRANTSSGSSADSNIVSVYITTSLTTIQSFFSATTWIAPSGTTSVEYLIVGGGGGGGGGYDNAGGGGGGAGLVLTASSYIVTPAQQYSITVGTGGAGGQGRSSTVPPAINTSGSSGLPSSFGSIIAAGGVGGYSSRRNNGVVGTQASSSLGTGGGGGGGGDSGAGGGAGGGGNGSAGSAGSRGTGGAGGTGTSKTTSGHAVTYGAGGSGGSNTTTTNGTSGAAFTGNGGGAISATSSQPNPSTLTAGTGGSGIVILTY
uniref:Fibronectin type-III domain-containing protein n=1 Tax=viral metagenome TaxID=1070528 RepID=A0A6C0AQV7_9ZZZZ